MPWLDDKIKLALATAKRTRSHAAKKSRTDNRWTKFWWFGEGQIEAFRFVRRLIREATIRDGKLGSSVARKPSQYRWKPDAYAGT